MNFKAYPQFFSAVIMASLLFLGACSDPQFGAVRGQKNDKIRDRQTASFQQCSNFTLVRPKVDLLFVWDNSSSSIFINNQTKQALNQVVENVSSRFDYHIVLAPLLVNGNSPNWNMKLVTHDTAGLSTSAMSMRIAKDQAANSLNFPLGTGSNEAGLERVRSIITNNMDNGVFRNGAYTIIVLMSTENDNEYFNHFGLTDFGSDPLARDYADIKINELLCLRGNTNRNCSSPTTLNSAMMRFISIVPYTTGSSCGIANAKRGLSYLYASQKIYDERYTNMDPSFPSDQNGRSKPVFNNSFGHMGYDSINICQRKYSDIFDGVNNVIQDTVISHKYNRWPVAGPNASVDPNSLVVMKSNGQEFYPVGSGSVPPGVSGYRYIGNQQGVPTRFEPSIGEPFTGHMIELFGSAQVTYPECLMVTSTTVREYYGYAVLGTGRPLESSIELRINGSLIPKCSSAATCSNGWVLEDFLQNNKNIKIVSPTDTSPAIPADNRSGYFLRLFGNAIYTNGDNVNVNWLPSGN